MNLSQVFLLLSSGGVFVGLFSAALLKARPDSVRAHGSLAVLLVVGAANIAHPLIMQAFAPHWVHSVRVLEPLQFLMAPAFAAYIRSLFVPARPWRPVSLIHLVPTVVVLGLGQTALFTRLDDHSGLPWGTIGLWTALLIQSAFYQILSVRWLHRYRRALTDTVSNTAGVDLGWLSWVLHIMVLLYFLYVVVLVLLLHDWANFPYRTVLSVVLSVLEVALCFRGLLQKQPPLLDPEQAAALKYQRSTPPESESAVVEGRLERLMTQERAYLDPDLSLPVLADRLGVARNVLSYVINQRLGRNFYDYVNGYRVDEVKRLFQDPSRRDHKLLAIAFDAGFRSKPAFNAVFKKMTTLTPSEYRQRVPSDSTPSL